MPTRRDRTARRALNVESLESRLVPARAGLAAGTLVISGSHGPDTIDVRQQAGLIRVEGVGAWPVAAVRAIRVLAHNGDDFVTLRDEEGGSAVTVPATVFGGHGNDTVAGGNGNDWLYGGPGADKLEGGAGVDRLYGNAGADELDGGAGGDWLEAGSAAESASDGWNAHRWADGTDAKDIDQQEAGTCSLLAALAAASRVGINLSGRVSYLGNFTYRVQLYNRAARAWTFRDVRFDGAMVRTSTGLVVDPDTQAQGEFWVLLYQRAYMKYCGINPMNGDLVARFDGDDPVRALSIVTGRTVAYDWSTAVTPQLLRARLQRGDAVTVGTVEDVANPFIIGGHAYMVEDVFQDDGVWKLRLYNPWGFDGFHMQGENDGYVTVEWSTFPRDFDVVATALRP